MPRSRTLRVVLVALPGVVTALAGLAHPVLLTPETAERWRLVHLALLPAFPLLGASVWLLLLGERGALAWAARAAAVAWAVLYGALDTIAGIGAPHQLLRTVERGEPRPPVEDLYEVGDRLGHLGVAALALAVVLAAAVLLRRPGHHAAVVVGALLALAGAWLVYRHHVFPPRGVGGALLVAGGLAVMAAAAGRPAGRPTVVAAR